MQQISIRFLIGDITNSSNDDKWNKIIEYFKSLLPLHELQKGTGGNYVVIKYTIDEQNRMREYIIAPTCQISDTLFYIDIYNRQSSLLSLLRTRGFYPTSVQYNIIIKRVSDIYGILYLNITPNVSLFERKPLYVEEPSPMEAKPIDSTYTEFIKKNNLPFNTNNTMEKIKIDYVKKVILSDTDAVVDAEAAVKHTAQKVDMEIMNLETQKSELDMKISSLKKEYPLDFRTISNAKIDKKGIEEKISVLKEIKSELGLSAN